ncbi:MAG: AN1-type zinc finger domain-containing protein [Candidatus Thorarchaeota archaeon]
MTRCSLCGKEDLCFTCPYCNKPFCADHRLPENHNCPAMQEVHERAREKRIRPQAPKEAKSNQSEQLSISLLPKLTSKLPKRKTGRFSKREIRDLLIASALVVLVGLSLTGSTPIIGGIAMLFSPYWWYPVATIVLFLTAFMVHELAHKFTAQSFGMWSEFRMTTYGYLLSAMAILFRFPVFGTGAVMTRGRATLEEHGKANLAGPLSNFIMGLIIVGVAALSSVLGFFVYPINQIIRFGLMLNAVLGLFNMIPVQPFDGGTVLRWNKKVWGLQVVGLAALLVFLYFGLPLL